MDYSKQILFCSQGTPLILSAMNQLIHEGYDYYYSRPRGSFLGTLGKVGLAAGIGLGAGHLINDEAMKNAEGKALNWAGDTWNKIKGNFNGTMGATGQPGTSGGVQNVAYTGNAQDNNIKTSLGYSANTPESKMNAMDQHILRYRQAHPEGAVIRGEVAKDPYEPVGANYNNSSTSTNSNSFFGLGKTDLSSQYGVVTQPERANISKSDTNLSQQTPQPVASQSVAQNSQPQQSPISKARFPKREDIPVTPQAQPVAQAPTPQPTNPTSGGGVHANAQVLARNMDTSSNLKPNIPETNTPTQQTTTPKSVTTTPKSTVPVQQHRNFPNIAQQQWIAQGGSANSAAFNPTTGQQYGNINRTSRA